MPDSISPTAIEQIASHCAALNDQKNSVFASDAAYSYYTFGRLACIIITYIVAIKSLPVWMVNAHVYTLFFAFFLIVSSAHSVFVVYTAKENKFDWSVFRHVLEKWRKQAQNMSLPCSSSNAISETRGNNVCHRVAAANRSGIAMQEMFCGTIIDIQGCQGSLIPHRASLGARDQDHRFTWILPFVLTANEYESLEKELFVGRKVEFCILQKQENHEKLVAFAIKPIDPSAEEIQKEILNSRHALLSCKQARQKSFVKAMEEITAISPRHEPVIHHVDLIQYAADLDAQD